MDRRAKEAGPPVPFVDLRASTEAIRNVLLADIEELLDAGAFVNGPAVEAFERAFAAVRKIALALSEDRSLSPDIARVAEAIRRGDFDDNAD